MILSELKKSSILVVGDIMLDSYLRGKSLRLSQEAPVPVVLIDTEDCVLGGAANVAANLSQLGCRVSLCGFIGNDYAGECIFNLVKSYNIDPHSLVRITDKPTIIKTRIISNDQHVVRYDKELFIDNEEDHNSIIKNILSFKNDSFDVVIISDYNKGTISANTVQAIKNHFNAKIIVDPKPNNKELYSNVYCIAPNASEIMSMFPSSGVIQSGIMALKTLNLENIIITVSEKGAILINTNGCYHVDAYNISTTERHHRMDVAGAGDTLISAYAACVSSGISPLESLVISNMAAAIVVNKLGTATCSIDDLNKELCNLEHELNKVKRSNLE